MKYRTTTDEELVLILEEGEGYTLGFQGCPFMFLYLQKLFDMIS